MNKFTPVARALCFALTAAVVAGCGSGAANESTKTDSTSKATDESIHDALPEKIREAGSITVVASGTRPPFWMTEEGDEDYIGAGADLMDAVGEVMGVDVEIVSMPDISGAFAAISSERYAFGFPYADMTGGPNERPGAEFVDVLMEVVPFLVKAGNPEGVTSLDELCDATAAASVNAATHVALKEQAKKCQAEGKDLKVLGVESIPDGVLAVKSGRADAFFTGGAPLFYAAKESNGELEVVGEDHGNGFEGSFMGAMLPEGSDLTQPVLDAFQTLFDNGTYEQIMKEWGLDAQIIDEPGLNLYSEWLAEQS